MDILKVHQTEPRSFRLVGELDLSGLGCLRPIEAVASSPGDIHLDLTRLRFVDGAGLDRLADLARQLGRTGDAGRVVVLRPPRSVERLLKRVSSSENLDNLVVVRLSSVVDDSLEISEPARDLNQILVSDYPPEAVCKLIAELAVSEVPGAESACVAIRSDGDVAFAASSDHAAEHVQTASIELGEGPAIDTVRSGQRHLSHSLVTEQRWPQFTNAAMYLGIASVLSEPLPVRGTTIGALTVLSARENAFGESACQGIARLASRGAVVIANAVLYWQSTELAGQLREALESRAVIDQAKGILMARDHISADEAFAMMLKASQRSNQKVRDIAQRLVAEINPIPAEKGLS